MMMWMLASELIDCLRVIEYINTKEGVEWVTMENIADDFHSKNTPPKGALMPAKPGAILENADLKLETKQ